MDIALTDAFVDVAGGQADIAIRFGPLADPIWPFRRESQNFSLSVKGNIEANDGETLGQLAAAGVGITRVGAFSVATELASGALVPLLEEFNPGDGELIHAVFVGGANVPARVRAFVDSSSRTAKAGPDRRESQASR